MKILVAYESMHGSTRSIAENIGRALGAHAVVTTRPMRQVTTLEPFDAFVFGSTEVGGAWSPRACEFLHQHSSELAGKPVWLFGVGSSDALPRPLRGLRKRGELRRLDVCACAAVQPHGTRVFSGLVHADQRSGRVERFTRRVWPRHGDFRDWTQIVDWAEGIAATLTTAAA